jgi:type I restriction enzyme, S subunit
MIPEGWSITNLGEVAEVLDPQPDHRTPPEVFDGIPYIGVNDFLPNGEINIQSCRKVSKEVWTKQQLNILVDEGGIIFGKIGTIGMPRLLPKSSTKYTLSANVVLIKPKINIAFILYFLQSEHIQNQINRTLHTTSQPALGIKKIRDLLIISPPLPEQCKIAEILGVWDESIALLEKLITAKRKLKQGLMQQLLTGKKRFKEFEGSEYAIKSLGEITKTFSGGTPSRSNLEYYSGNIPWIKSGELNTKNIWVTEEQITQQALKISSAKLVLPNTILVAMYGATAGVIGISRITAAINQAILAVVPNDSCINEYLFYFLEYSMVEVIKKVQGGQPNLNAQIIKSSSIRLPSPQEQEKIASVLSAADTEISNLEKQLAAYKQQKCGLMQQLLTGKTRVRVN